MPRRNASPWYETIDSTTWHTVADRYSVGARVQGKVISLMDYGAFVELESGIEGAHPYFGDVLDQKNSHPSKVLQVGQNVEVVVLNVDPATVVFPWD